MAFIITKKNGKRFGLRAIFTATEIDRLRGDGNCYTVVNTTTRRASKIGATCRTRKAGLGALPSWWPFKKKPAKRHPMTRTVYMMKTKSGSYIPVDRPPSHSMSGARRRRKRR